MIGPVPAERLTVAVPSHIPLQETFVVVVLATIAGGFVNVVFVSVIQPFASVTCNEYVPAVIPVKKLVVAPPGDQR